MPNARAMATGGAVQSPSPAGVILAVLALLGGVILGYAGQSVVTIGAPAKVSLSASVTGTSGGIGRYQPVRVQLLIGVANTGSAAVRVVGGGSDTGTTSIKSLTPAAVDVPPGGQASFSADAAVHCESPQTLTLPALQVQTAGGEQATVTLGGAGALVEACARGLEDEIRPLVASSAETRPPDDGDAVSLQCTLPTSRPCPQLSLGLASPTGRPADIRSFSAGGVVLPSSLLFPGRASATGLIHIAGDGNDVGPILLTAPGSCPPEWRSAGLPSWLDLRLADGSTYALRVGPLLPTWLLQTACNPQHPAGPIGPSGLS